MTELLVGLLAGVLSMLPVAWVLRDRLLFAEERRVAEQTGADEAINRLLLKLEARSFTESVSIEALLNRPDPGPAEPAGRWLHSDDGLVTEFVPD